MCSGAPEAINSSILTSKSDIFSLGLIIQEIYLYTLSNEDRLPTEENVWNNLSNSFVLGHSD